MANQENNDAGLLREQLAQALASAEQADANGVVAQTLRLVVCAIEDRDVLARSRGACDGCSRTDIIDLLETMVAQRDISAKEYDEAGRVVEADREREEIAVLEVFLPQPLLGLDLERAVAEIIARLGATKLKDVSRCMAALRDSYPGQIECNSAGQAVREALSHKR